MSIIIIIIIIINVNACEVNHALESLNNDGLRIKVSSRRPETVHIYICVCIYIYI